MFQIYIHRDRALSAEFVERCIVARYDALCLTIDTVVAGNRERDRVTGMEMPPRFTLSSLASFATSPEWVWGYLMNRRFDLENVKHRVDALDGKNISVIDYVNSQFDRSANWTDVEAIRKLWPGPFVVKGIQSVADARRAVDAGATALMLSNHGGRQLDGTLAPIQLVSRVRDAVGDGIEIIVDGGVRRGTHILKAIASGANACSVGRPYLYGLAAGGEAGVDRALRLLGEELQRDMILLGASRIHEITSDCIDQ